MSSKNKTLAQILRERGYEVAPSQFQKSAMGIGREGQTWNEIIADVILAEAASRKQWAVEMYRDTAEGKPTQAVKDTGGDRATEERLDDNARQHLNALAGSAPTDERADSEPGPIADESYEDPPIAAGQSAASTLPDLDLPKDGDNDSESSGSEPAVAEENPGRVPEQ
jgi:hypothetical protein